MFFLCSTPGDTWDSWWWFQVEALGWVDPCWFFPWENWWCSKWIFLMSIFLVLTMRMMAPGEDNSIQTWRIFYRGFPADLILRSGIPRKKLVNHRNGHVAVLGPFRPSSPPARNCCPSRCLHSVRCQRLGSPRNLVGNEGFLVAGFGDEYEESDDATSGGTFAHEFDLYNLRCTTPWSCNSVWRFPKIGVPLNPLFWWDFPL